jgi:hypothetical protein
VVTVGNKCDNGDCPRAVAISFNKLWQAGRPCSTPARRRGTPYLSEKKACTLTNKTIVANYCGLSSLGLTVGCGLAVDAWEGRERLWALFRGKGFEGHNLLHIPAQARAQGLQLDIRAARRQAHDKLHHGNRQNHEFRNVEDNRKQHHE